MRVLSTVADFPENGRIYVYGAGHIGQRLVAALAARRPDITVLGFVDTFERGLVHKLEVVGPEDLAVDHGESVVIASLVFRDEIANTLTEMGVSEFFAVHPLLDLLPIRESAPRVLYAFYDIAMSPPTFDIVGFLLMAELDRLERGLDAIHAVIVPAPPTSFAGVSTPWSGREPWRARNLLLPCCWLLPSCVRGTVARSRAEASTLAENSEHLFPRGYTIADPVGQHAMRQLLQANVEIWPTLRAPPEPLATVAPWAAKMAQGRRLVTVTLRECSYDQARNSNFEAWSAFLGRLDDSKYLPVIVRDTGAALDPPPPGLEDYPVFHAAAWNLEMRMALYEVAWLNLFVNNGPAMLCVLDQEAACLIYGMWAAPESSFDTPAVRHAVGFEVGGQLPMATRRQRMIWEPDTLEVLEREFHAMAKHLEDE